MADYLYHLKYAYPTTNDLNYLISNPYSCDFMSVWVFIILFLMSMGDDCSLWRRVFFQLLYTASPLLNSQGNAAQIFTWFSVSLLSELRRESCKEAFENSSLHIIKNVTEHILTLLLLYWCEPLLKLWLILLSLSLSLSSWFSTKWVLLLNLSMYLSIHLLLSTQDA